MKRLCLILGLFMSILSTVLVASPALATECEEWVNPHGGNVPPAGWSTLPGDNPNSGKNPDGFYRIKAHQDPGVNEVWFSYVGYEGPTVQGGPTGALFGPFYMEAIPDSLPKHAGEGANDGWISQFVFKVTEAPGAAPSVKKIGSINGQAGAVAIHIRVPADVIWMVRFSDGGVVTGDCCVVPPPPK